MNNFFLALFDGDPETPNYPSLENVYRIPEPMGLPKIPCQPIGYRGAKELLNKLKGKPVPDGWKGGILDIEYVIGGEFIDDCSECFVRYFEISYFNTCIFRKIGLFYPSMTKIFMQ